MAQASFEKAKEKGSEKLLTYVRTDNQGAIEFYLKLGFSIIGIHHRQAKIGRTYVDEVAIEKLF